MSSENGRSTIVGSGQYPRMQNDMETKIHNIEHNAYTSVQWAFKAQSDAITWVPLPQLFCLSFYYVCCVGLTMSFSVPMYFRKKNV